MSISYGKMDLKPSFFEMSFDIKPQVKDEEAFGHGARPTRPKPPKHPGVNWDDIAGLDLAKEALREAIEYPNAHKELYRGYGHPESKGVLLYGPPGCGKTMLAKAVATAVSTLRKVVTGEPRRDMFGIVSEPADLSGFISVKGSEILDPYVGGSEKKVRELFDKARAYERKAGERAVIFIDEAEAILSCRQSSRSFVSSMCVPTFLAEMDGVEGSGAFVILSTNRVDDLDSAITRDGRIDVKVEVTRPGREQVRQMLDLNLRNIPLADNVNRDDVCADMFSSTHVVTSGIIGETTVELILGEVLSGAAVAGIVKKAISSAIKRDREAGVTEPSGVSAEDFRHAVRRTAVEMKDLNWRDEMTTKALAALKSSALHSVARAATGTAN